MDAVCLLLLVPSKWTFFWCRETFDLSSILVHTREGREIIIIIIIIINRKIEGGREVPGPPTRFDSSPALVDDNLQPMLNSIFH